LDSHVHGASHANERRADEIGIDNQIVLEVEALFAKLDEDKDEYISEEELSRALIAASNGKCTEEQAKDTFAVVDINQDGKISRDDFNDFMIRQIKQEIVNSEDQMEDLKEKLHQLNLDGSGYLPTTEI